jgi:endonuclease YncB( thermonuclease family)
MAKMTLLAILASAALCASPSVHDGDSIRCGSERIRIENIDSPELPGSPHCALKRRRALAGSNNPAWCDDRAGFEARDALRAFLAKGQVRIERSGTDRYGRTLARVTVNGKDAGAYLIGIGLARRWE